MMAIGCESGTKPNAPGTGGNETQGNCDGLGTLNSGGQLALASGEHTPTPLENKVTAFLWGIDVLIQEDQTIDPFLLEEPFNELLAAIPTEYPALFPSPAVCSVTQALVSDPNDFACNNDCIPSPLLLEKTGEALLDKVAAEFISQLKALGKYSQYIQNTRDQLAGVKNNVHDLSLTHAVTKPQQYTDLYTSIDQVITDGEANASLNDLLDVVKTFAELADSPTVATAVLAFQIGWEIGSAALLSSNCNDWKSAHCPSVSIPTLSGSSPTLTGVFTAVATETERPDSFVSGGELIFCLGCTYQDTLTSTFTLSNFTGDGDLINPYQGSLSGPSARSMQVISCDDPVIKDGSTNVGSFVGTVSGTSGQVIITGGWDSPNGFGDFSFGEGIWDGTSITFTSVSVTMLPTDQCTTYQPFTGTLVLSH